MRRRIKLSEALKGERHLHANYPHNNILPIQERYEISTIQEDAPLEIKSSESRMVKLKHSESGNNSRHKREEWRQYDHGSTQASVLSSAPWKRTVRTGMVVALFFLILLFGVTGLVWLSDYFPTNVTSVQAIGQKHFGQRFFDKAAVASEHPICSNLGKQAMHKGGSAVDATIVVLLCIGVVNNQSSGLGGGGFMLIKGVGKDAEILDFRETAPSGAHRDMFKDDPRASRAGGMAVAVPGEVAGMHEAHSKYGLLPWKELFDMAASVAREGFPVSRQLHLLIVRNEAEMRNYKELSELYLPQGKPLQTGDLLRRENLAQTLELIGKEGWRAFYEGEIARSIVETVQRNGGVLTMQDMAEYKAMIRSTIKSTFDDTVVITGSAPTGGPVLLHALNIVEGFKDLQHPFLGQDIHLIVEALKFAYAARMRLGDPSFNLDMKKITKRMVDKRLADRLRQRIDVFRTHAPDYYASHTDIINPHGTTHVSAVDPNGLAVSATSTINLEFGSLLLDPSTGIILNSEMDDFSIPGHDNAFGIPPSASNYIAPGKRPQSSCAPVIVEREGEAVLVLGGTGGSRIISSLVQLMIGMIRFGGNPFGAVALPRLHHQLIPNAVAVENGYNEELIDVLRGKGHQIIKLSSDTYLAAIQLVQIDPTRKTGRLVAVADPRKGGSADGF